MGFIYEAPAPHRCTRPGEEAYSYLHREPTHGSYWRCDECGAIYRYAVDRWKYVRPTKRNLRRIAALYPEAGK